jgi:cytochrome c-type biogenesis protein
MTWLLALGTSFWLGILTSISPCPLASNVAAISYLTREASRPRQMLFSGVLYSLGRSATYVTLGALIAASLLNVPSLAFFLQSKMNQILGPVLILAGIILLGWVRIPLPGFAPGEGTVSRIRALGGTGRSFWECSSPFPSARFRQACFSEAWCH